MHLNGMINYKMGRELILKGVAGLIKKEEEAEESIKERHRELRGYLGGSVYGETGIVIANI